MKIVDIQGTGGPEVLALAERAVPAPGAGEVLIKVAAAGLNRADLLQRQGKYPAPAGAPAHPGLEVSGIVEHLGEGVTEFHEGDLVCALLQGGGYAEYVCAPEAQVLPLPVGVDLIQGAALPEACFTVWSNVFMFGHLSAGETLLVHGGTSGIGVTAIQLARARGARVLATAGSDEKCRVCESLGATPINYRTQDFVAAVRELTRVGVQVILDMIAGEYTARNIEALAEDGRLVVIATQGGAASTINLLKVMQKRATITGSTLRPRSTEFKAEVKRQLLQSVWPAISGGTFRIVVDRTFPMSEAPAAHRRMESGEHIGKILLTMSS